MQLRPLGDRVVVKPLPQEEVTKSGIILHTDSKERPERGEVVAIGSGRLLDDGRFAPMHVKVGDTVVFKKYSPDEVKVDDREYLVISESDIMAVIE